MARQCSLLLQLPWELKKHNLVPDTGGLTRQIGPTKIR